MEITKKLIFIRKTMEGLKIIRFPEWFQVLVIKNHIYYNFNVEQIMTNKQHKKWTNNDNDLKNKFKNRLGLQLSLYKICLKKIDSIVTRIKISNHLHIFPFKPNW